MSAEAIRKMFATIDDRRWERLPLHFAGDVVYERPGYPPMRGLDELCHFYSTVRIVAAGEHLIEQIIAGGEHAACWGSFRGRARNGRELSERFADVYSLQDGLIVYRTTYFFRAAI
jgi:ketosteroid isomerase-like protein